MTHIYYAFATPIHSDWPLPSLSDSIDHQSTTNTNNSPIVIKKTTVSQKIHQKLAKKPFFIDIDKTIYFKVGRVATFAIKNGEEVAIEAETDADPNSLEIYTLGSAMSAVLTQRGYWVFHGNVIRFNNNCSVFTGPSGIGKSTLAQAFSKAGVALLSDDLCVIDIKSGIPMAIPAYPRLKLTPQSLSFFNQSATQADRVGGDIEKYYQPMPDYYPNPLPISEIYCLENTASSSIVLNPLSGMAAFKAFIQNMHRPHFVQALGLGADQLLAFKRIEKHVKLYQLARPQKLEIVDEIVKKISQKNHDPR